MNVVAAVVILVISAQGESLPEVDWPDAIQMKNGDMIFAFVDADQWKKTQMKAVLDAPWLEPQAQRVTIWSRDIKETYRESNVERNNRLTTGYEAAGFKNLETGAGELWIHESEIALAERAFALERLALEKTSMADAGAEAEIVGEALVEPQHAPFLDLWGRHIALAGVALVLAGLVFWGLIRS